MQHPAIFLVVVVLAVSPLTTTAAVTECNGGLGLYAANSTYKANLRRLAAILPAATASAQSLKAIRGVGNWPNRLQAFSGCWGVSSTACAACIADAFHEAERVCPYGRKVVVLARNCTLSLAAFRRVPVRAKTNFFFFGSSSLVQMFGAGLVFQAIGFAWLLFLLLQEWRDKRRDSMMHSISIPSGDQ